MSKFSILLVIFLISVSTVLANNVLIIKDFKLDRKVINGIECYQFNHFLGVSSSNLPKQLVSAGAFFTATLILSQDDKSIDSLNYNQHLDRNETFGLILNAKNITWSYPIGLLQSKITNDSIELMISCEVSLLKKGSPNFANRDNPSSSFYSEGIALKLEKETFRKLTLNILELSYDEDYQWDISLINRSSAETYLMIEIGNYFVKSETYKGNKLKNKETDFYVLETEKNNSFRVLVFEFDNGSKDDFVGETTVKTDIDNISILENNTSFKTRISY
jgi:hypothetical protein